MLLFSSAYNEYTVISKEYTGPLDFDITGVDCTLRSIMLHMNSRVRRELKTLNRRAGYCSDCALHLFTFPAPTQLVTIDLLFYI